MLRVRNLTKRYGNTEVVRGLDLDVRRGECFGAGKTDTSVSSSNQHNSAHWFSSGR